MLLTTAVVNSSASGHGTGSFNVPESSILGVAVRIANDRTPTTDSAKFNRTGPPPRTGAPREQATSPSTHSPPQQIDRDWFGRIAVEPSEAGWRIRLIKY